MGESVRHALVTGVSIGIDGTTAHRLYELGQDVVTVARREERLAALIAETGCRYVVIGLSDETAVGALTARVLGGGSVDALVDNADDALRVDTIVHADLDR